MYRRQRVRHHGGGPNLAPYITNWNLSVTPLSTATSRWRSLCRQPRIQTDWFSRPQPDPCRGDRPSVPASFPYLSFVTRCRTMPFQLQQPAATLTERLSRLSSLPLHLRHGLDNNSRIVSGAPAGQHASGEDTAAATLISATASLSRRLQPSGSKAMAITGRLEDQFHRDLQSPQRGTFSRQQQFHRERG